MRSLLKIAFAFCGPLLLAGFAQAADPCDAKVPTYVVAGDIQSKADGARTWDLAALSKAVTNGEQCSVELMKRALDESKNYWAKVAERYSCTGAPKAIPANTQVEVPAKQCKTSNDNLNYIRIMQFGHKPTDATGKPDCLNCVGGKPETLSGKANENLQDVSHVLERIPPPNTPSVSPKETCQGVSKADRAGADQLSTTDQIVSVAGRCVKGFVEGILKEPFDMLKGIWGSLTHPFATVASLVDLGRSFVVHPIQTSEKVVIAMVHHFSDSYANWNCFNARKMSETLCQSMGQVTSDVIMSIVGGNALVPVVAKGVKAAVGLGADTAAVVGTGAKVVGAGAKAAAKTVVKAGVKVAEKTGKAVGDTAIVAKQQLANAGHAVRKGVDAVASVSGAIADKTKTVVTETAAQVKGHVSAKAQALADAVRAGGVNPKIVKKYNSIFRSNPSAAESKYLSSKELLATTRQEAEKNFAAARASGASAEALRNLELKVLRAADEQRSLEAAYSKFKGARPLNLDN